MVSTIFSINKTALSASFLAETINPLSGIFPLMCLFASWFKVVRSSGVKELNSPFVLLFITTVLYFDVYVSVQDFIEYRPTGAGIVFKWRYL